MDGKYHRLPPNPNPTPTQNTNQTGRLFSSVVIFRPCS